MRAFIKDDEYQGTPEEIDTFLALRESRMPSTVIGERLEPPFAPDDFEPFEEVINDSEELRKKLADDPAYNPFGGVVPSKESEPDTESPALSAPFTAEADTGVEIQ